MTYIVRALCALINFIKITTVKVDIYVYYIYNFPDLAEMHKLYMANCDIFIARTPQRIYAVEWAAEMTRF